MRNIFRRLLLLLIIPLVSFANDTNKSFVQIVEKSEELAAYPRLEYPNSSFDQLSSYFESGKVLIFAYDTLTNPASAAQSLSVHTMVHMKPGIAFGLYRLLNVDGQVGGFKWDLNTPSWIDEYVPRGSHLATGKAVINAIPTSSLDDQINGVLFEVNETELQKLIEREAGYDLIPVIVMDWQDKSPCYCGTPRVAYTFSASNEPRNGIIYTKENISPSIRYMDRLREGFYRTETGKVIPASQGFTSFRSYFENCTFMWDGTSVNKQFYIKG